MFPPLDIKKIKKSTNQVSDLQKWVKLAVTGLQPSFDAYRDQVKTCFNRDKNCVHYLRPQSEALDFVFCTIVDFITEQDTLSDAKLHELDYTKIFDSGRLVKLLYLLGYLKWSPEEKTALQTATFLSFEKLMYRDYVNIPLHQRVTKGEILLPDSFEWKKYFFDRLQDIEKPKVPRKTSLPDQHPPADWSQDRQLLFYLVNPYHHDYLKINEFLIRSKYYDDTFIQNFSKCSESFRVQFCQSLAFALEQKDYDAAIVQIQFRWSLKLNHLVDTLNYSTQQLNQQVVFTSEFLEGAGFQEYLDQKFGAPQQEEARPESPQLDKSSIEPKQRPNVEVRSQGENRQNSVIMIDTCKAQVQQTSLNQIDRPLSPVPHRPRPADAQSFFDEVEAISASNVSAFRTLGVTGLRQLNNDTILTGDHIKALVTSFVDSQAAIAKKENSMKLQKLLDFRNSNFGSKKDDDQDEEEKKE